MNAQCTGGASGTLAKIPLKMADIKVTASVRPHKEESGFFIDAALDGDLGGTCEQQAEALVAKASGVLTCRSRLNST